MIMRRTTSETCYNYHTPKNVVDFVFNEGGHARQKRICVAMIGSVGVTFSDPIANVQGLAFLAWENKVDIMKIRPTLY